MIDKQSLPYLNGRGRTHEFTLTDEDGGHRTVVYAVDHHEAERIATQSTGRPMFVEGF